MINFMVFIKNMKDFFAVLFMLMVMLIYLPFIAIFGLYKDD